MSKVKTAKQTKVKELFIEEKIEMANKYENKPNSRSSVLSLPGFISLSCHLVPGDLGGDSLTQISIYKNGHNNSTYIWRLNEIQKSENKGSSPKNLQMSNKHENMLNI